MKIIYGTFKFLLGIGFLTLGILLIPYQFEEIYQYVDEQYETFLQQVPDTVPVREIGGGIIGFVGLLMFGSASISLIRSRKKPKAVSFIGMHGEVTIQLDPIERMLAGVVTKLPEVNSAVVILKPTESPGRVKVEVKAVLSKNADDDARMVTARVQHFIQQHTKKILGLNEVDVSLNVIKFNMKMKTVKPDLLLLEAPGGVPEEMPPEAQVAIARAAQDVSVVDAKPEDPEARDELALER